MISVFSPPLRIPFSAVTLTIKSRSVAAIFFLCCFVILGQKASAERLNHAIALFEKDQAAFGIFSGDRSFANARSLARAPIDFVLIDMEHGPYDSERLQAFLLGMTDKNRIAQTGSLQMQTTPIVRIPVNGREMNQFLAKQVLDMGAFGVMFPMINSREEAENAIASVRYPQERGAADHEPKGLRGKAPSRAIWYWGTSGAEYIEKADVWPLDPNGEILAVIQIESPEAVANAEDIITTPGIGAIFVGPTDLSANMGLPRSHPEVEAAIQQVLALCKRHNIPCGITTNAGDIQARTEQGFRFVTVGGDAGISPATAQALEIGRAAANRD